MLIEHLRNVAETAAAFARPIGLAGEAELAGMLHDLGKYQDDFQSYLKHGRPRTPHAAFGATAVSGSYVRLANVIASHSDGLYEWPELSPKLAELLRVKKDTLAFCLKRLTQESVAPP